MTPTPPLTANASLRRGPGLFSRRSSEPDPLLAIESNDPRAGSTLAQGRSGSTTTAADPRALNDVMTQLQSIGATDPAVQAKLMEDMQRTDPSLWPLLMQTYRSSLAYQNQTRAAAYPSTAGAAGVQAPPALPNAVPPEIRDGRVGLTASNNQAAQAGSPSPWNALAVPTATGSDQVVLASAPLPTATPPAATAPAAQPPAAVPPAPPTAVAAQPTAPPPAQLQAPPATTPTSPPAASEPPPLPAAAAAPIAAASATPPAAQNANVQQAAFTAQAAGTGPSPEIAAAIAALEKQTQTPAKDAADVSRQLSLRMLYLSVGRRDDALRPIDGLSPTEQDFWSKQLTSVSTWLDVGSQPDAGQRALAATQRLNEAASRLAELSPLTVKNIAFCTEVSSYGVVTPFKETEYAPGQQVLLYAEVENYKTEHTPKGFRTALKSGYQVVDKQGVKMAGTESQMMEEVCQNQRHDYFVRYRLNLPKPLPDGAYTLQLTIEDTLGQKTGKASVDFTIKNK
jgi:hypothetical protein